MLVSCFNHLVTPPPVEVLHLGHVGVEPVQTPLVEKTGGDHLGIILWLEAFVEELSGSFLIDVLLEERGHLRKGRGVQNGHLHVKNNALDQLLGT